MNPCKRLFMSVNSLSILPLETKLEFDINSSLINVETRPSFVAVQGFSRSPHKAVFPTTFLPSIFSLFLAMASNLLAMAS